MEVEKQPVSLSAILSVRHKERQMVSQYLIHLIRYMVRQPGRQMDGQSVSRTRKRIDRPFVVIYYSGTTDTQWTDS